MQNKNYIEMRLGIIGIAAIVFLSLLVGNANIVSASSTPHATSTTATLVAANCEPIWIGMWNGTEQLIFNKVLPNGNFDAYVGNLSCGDAKPLFSYAWNGSRAVSSVTPNGRYVMLEVEFDSTHGNGPAEFGSGVDNQLELLDRDTGKLTELTFTDKYQINATIWATLNNNATAVLWSQLNSPVILGGYWNLHVANITFKDGTPSLTNVRTYSYPSEKSFFEAYAFYDGKILFVSNAGITDTAIGTDAQDQYINASLAPGSAPVIISHQINGSWYFHEFQTVAPAGMFSGGPWILTSIVYNNAYAGEDIWRMELNGSGLQRVTYFNGNASGGRAPGFPEPQYSDATFPIVDPYNSSVFYTAVSTSGLTYADRDYFYDYKIQITQNTTTSLTTTIKPTTTVSTTTLTTKPTTSVTGTTAVSSTTAKSTTVGTAASTTTVAQLSYTVTLKQGWNLVSSPFSVVTGAYGNAGTTCTPSELVSPLWELGSSGYQVADLISGGSGYWIEAKNPCAIEFTGTSLFSTSGYPQLSTGWNLIGAPLSQTEFSSIKGTCTLTSGPLSYNATSSSYYNASTLNPGNGYLVDVSKPCRLS